MAQKNPLVKLEIDGNASDEGSVNSNMKLSLARANVVKRKLIELGIAGYRLTAKGFGATRPLQPNNTDGGKTANRRVEFIIE